jgi:hypothetical protein
VGGLLISICLLKALEGSVGPSCFTQCTSSPARLDFVCGRANTLVCRPLSLSLSCTSPTVMCSAGLKVLSLGSVNSPMHAAI